MSLKAKIEAVIYASEEPVTLAQLTGLLGHEAQAELDHLDSAQHSLALDEAATAASGEEEQLESPAAGRDEDALNGEVLSEDAEALLEIEIESETSPATETSPDAEAEAQHAEALDRHMH